MASLSINLLPWRTGESIIEDLDPIFFEPPLPTRSATPASPAQADAESVEVEEQLVTNKATKRSKKAAEGEVSAWLAEQGYGKSAETTCTAMKSAEIPSEDWLSELKGMKKDGTLQAFIDTLSPKPEAAAAAEAAEEAEVLPEEEVDAFLVVAGSEE